MTGCLYIIVLYLKAKDFQLERKFSFSDLPLATVSALSLTSVTSIAADKKLEEEKKKTEAERHKNGKYAY